MILGLAGPAVLKSHVKLFKPVSGGEGLTASLERLTTQLQDFSFSQIKRALAQERLARKERLARLPEDRLKERLQAIYTATEMAKIEPLIDERRAADPDSVGAFIISLIEKRDPDALATLEEA